MKRTLLVSVLACWLVLGPHLASADPPVADQARAATLHTEAIKLFGSKKLDAASRLWREAEQAHPIWKYAFNLAGALLELGQPLDAWAALERARQYGVPEAIQPRVTELAGRVAVVLSKTRGLLEIRPTPPDAQVRVDGAALGTRVWLPAGTVTVQVERAGFQRQTVSVSVVVGEERAVTVALVAVERRPPTLVRQSLDVEPEAPAREPIELVFDSGPSAQTIAGYSTLGVGVALAVVGGGLLGWAESLAEDAEAENKSPSTADYAAYSDRFADDRARYDSVRIGGWTTLGVGLAAAVTGLTLVLVDDDGASGSVLVQPDGVRTTWRF